MNAAQKETALARVRPQRAEMTTAANRGGPATDPADAGPGRFRLLLTWLGGHERATAIGVALLLVATVVTAAVMIRQDISVNPTAQAPEVAFANGADYAAINNAGFATLTLGSSATSASLDLEGVPGAALVSLTDVLVLQNTEPALGQDYNVVLTRSALPDAAITAFVVTVHDSVDTVIATWDAVAAASSASFSLPAATTYDITIAPVIADGTAAGALGTFDMQFELAPA